MPPSPPTAARREARTWLALTVLPLALGFATGAWLATASAPPAASEPDRAAPTTRISGVADPTLAAPASDRAERARRRARARRHARLAATSRAAPADAPTRRRVQERIDAIDPRVWLASYGTVIETRVADGQPSTASPD